MCHGIGLHTFLYAPALKLTANGFYADGGRRRGRDVLHLTLWHGNFHLYGADVEDTYYGLRG